MKRFIAFVIAALGILTAAAQASQAQGFTFTFGDGPVYYAPGYYGYRYYNDGYYNPEYTYYYHRRVYYPDSYYRGYYYGPRYRYYQRRNYDWKHDWNHE
jgi:hypothetical protein